MRSLATGDYKSRQAAVRLGLASAMSGGTTRKRRISDRYRGRQPDVVETDLNTASRARPAGQCIHTGNKERCHALAGYPFRLRFRQGPFNREIDDLTRQREVVESDCALALSDSGKVST